ncbi:hypothetical protein IEO21_01080 [Rhodonia placenta]|uniref:RED-like N-terminal domain-containing protein n=1 Tax=Rhodonia placenta TaxID=104341 RepID=A0A8H7PA97_9APHY|nr:hypothetical protein IEO21_01080 [Postia placenta]
MCLIHNVWYQSSYLRKTVDASKPAFKPRTVKKKAEGTEAYRDRASERRLGLDSDYAQVEALADDFERKNADNADRKAVEEQRRYLGGDSEHTVLVKGLDYALLEQARSRVAASTAAEDDATLEQAFLETSSSVPKKRTREEIVQELKAKRAKNEGSAEPAPQLPGADVPLEEAKKAGKFRPIGFKPVGAGEKARKKKAKKAGGKEGEDTQKKTVKREAAIAEAKADEELPIPESSPAEAGLSQPVAAPPRPLLPDPEPIDDDVDIFADAGEYTGIDLGDDDDESDGEIKKWPHDEDTDQLRDEDAEQSPPTGQWFATDDGDRAARASSSKSEAPPEPAYAKASPPQSFGPPPEALEDGEEEEDERPMRLQPLASSALPSIRDLLEMDSAAGKKDKWRAKKEKKKEKAPSGEGKVDKDKIDRDYKRLKAYTDKKAAAGGGAAKT